VIAAALSQDHLSFTQLRSFVECPRQWHYRKVERAPVERIPVALAFGIAVHEAVAAANEGALTGTAVDAGAAFGKAWQEQTTAEVPIAYGEDDDAASLASKGTALVAVYQPPPRIVAVEQPIDVQLADDLPPLQGRIDLIRLDEAGELVVADVKTSGTRMLAEVEPVAAQLALYDVAYPALRHEAIILFKGKVPSQAVQAIQPWEQRRLVTWIREVHQAMRAGVRYAHRTRNCRNCPYRDRCARDE